MKSNEFINDIVESQIEICREELAKYPELFESTSEYQQFDKFMNMFATTPMVGTSYYLVCVTSVSTVITPVIITTPRVLVKIVDGDMYFDFDGSIKQFPENKQTGDLLIRTLLFRSAAEQDQFRTMLLLKFDQNWRIRITTRA